MADHTSNTQETPEPTTETSSAPVAAEPLPSETEPPEAAPEEPKRLSRQERRAVNLRQITETILESFKAHDNHMRARSKKPPKVARRICQIILHGPHSDGEAIVAVDEPYTLIVTANRMPVRAEEWRAGVMATLSERLGLPVHVTLMKEKRFLAHCREFTPFYQALAVSHDTLYPQREPEEVSLEVPLEVLAKTAETVGGNLGRRLEDDILLTRLLDDPDVRQLCEVLAREKKPDGYPDEHSVQMMEEPIRHITRAGSLLRDLVSGGHRHDSASLSVMGLGFIAHALTRETDILYRLYHGKAPAG